MLRLVLWFVRVFRTPDCEALMKFDGKNMNYACLVKFDGKSTNYACLVKFDRVMMKKNTQIHKKVHYTNL